MTITLEPIDIARIQNALILLRNCPPTIRQIIEAGDQAINAAGLNPWCMNEGRATGDEEHRLWYLPEMMEKLNQQLDIA